MGVGRIGELVGSEQEVHLAYFRKIAASVGLVMNPMWWDHQGS